MKSKITIKTGEVLEIQDSVILSNGDIGTIAAIIDGRAGIDYNNHGEIGIWVDAKDIIEKINGLNEIE